MQQPWQLGSPWVSICIIVMLPCQIWSCAAYDNQQAKWLTKHLSRASGHGAEPPTDGSEKNSATVIRNAGRRLQEESETVEYGWRASLVDEDHRSHSSLNLSSMERIARNVDRSKSRALNLDSRARAAPYVTSSPGRKALQSPSDSFESTTEATPGSYSMAFSLGTPAQNFVAIADTGSDLVWLQCATCTECFQQASPLFDPSSSSTYAPLGCTDACSALGHNEVQCSPNCQYTYSYGDQSSTKGDYSLDTVTLSNSNGTETLIPDFQFGCGLQNQGTFTDTDGIVGLARGPISFPSQIATYLNSSTKFSYCLVSRDEESNITSPIIFGEAAVPTNGTGVSYTPLQTPYATTSVPYYYVNLLGISVGSTNVSIPNSAFQIDSSGNGGTVFDSGTTYTVLVSDAYVPVVNEFNAQISTDYQQVNLTSQVGLDLCYDITGLSSVSVPSLVFHFENADFDLPFDNIFVVFSSDQSSYMCLSLLESSGMNIYGNSQQQNFQVVYEEDALQIGWVPVDCTSL